MGLKAVRTRRPVSSRQGWRPRPALPRPTPPLGKPPAPGGAARPTHSSGWGSGPSPRTPPPGPARCRRPGSGGPAPRPARLRGGGRLRAPTRAGPLPGVPAPFRGSSQVAPSPPHPPFTASGPRAPPLRREALPRPPTAHTVTRASFTVRAGEPLWGRRSRQPAPRLAPHSGHPGAPPEWAPSSVTPSPKEPDQLHTLPLLGLPRGNCTLGLAPPNHARAGPPPHWPRRGRGAAGGGAYLRK